MYRTRCPNEDINQLLRRIGHIYHLTEEYTGPMGICSMSFADSGIEEYRTGGFINSVSFHPPANENNLHYTEVEKGNNVPSQRSDNVEDSELSFDDIAAAINDLGL